MDTVFRLATAGDEAAIRRLFVEMLRTIFHTQEVEGYPAGYVGRFFTGGEDKILVAEQAGMVVGFLSLESHREGEPPFLYLDDFSVTAACRGQGIGSRLLDIAEEYAAALRLGEIHLHVERDNHGARRLYRRRGFGVLTEQGARLLLGKKL
ncbi:MAG: N-acetyltransferase family protein [Acutalibacter sp.]